MCSASTAKKNWGITAKQPMMHCLSFISFCSYAGESVVMVNMTSEVSVTLFITSGLCEELLFCYCHCCCHHLCIVFLVTLLIEASL